MKSLQRFEQRYDAVIVGARCAGASTALLLARAGAKVLLVDRQAYGSDTVSTHALMRTAVLQLHRWGILPDVMAAGTPAIRRTTFHYGPECVRVDIKPEHGVDFLCAPRRAVLDRVLADAARRAGADVRHGVSLAGLHTGLDGRVAGAVLKGEAGDAVSVRCGLVIGADGRQSTVARAVDANAYVEGRSGSGYVYGYYAGLPEGGTHWYFEEGVAAGVIPTNHDLHCVFTGVPADRFASTFRGDLERGLLLTAAANSPELAYAVRSARLVGRLRGFVSCPGYLKQSYGPGWALVGDAGYFKDPLTAHGISDALRDAEALSLAVLDGRPQAFARYQRVRDALSMPLLKVTDDIASFDWTLDEIKGHHARLSDVLKAEAHHVAGDPSSATLAA